MRRLPFLDPVYEHTQIRDFWEVREHDVPQAPGVYLLLAAAGTSFTYPQGRSPVFYIGKAERLRKRLFEHLRFSLEARYTRASTLYYPVYEYAAALGARYTYVLANLAEDPKQLEAEVLACFAETHRSWPVANGVGAWNALMPFEQLRGPRRQ